MLTFLRQLFCIHTWEEDPYEGAHIIRVECRKCLKPKEPWWVKFRRGK